MHPIKSSLHLRHLPLPVFTGQSEIVKKQLLGAICFSQADIGNLQFISSPSSSFAQGDGDKWTAGLPILQVTTTVDDAFCEVFIGGNHPSSGEKGNISYRHDGDMLFGVFKLPQTANAAQAASLQSTTESAYQQIFTLLDELQYPFTYRFWNYMSDINGISQGLERYRQFNLGRQEAYRACGREVKSELPAACALGLAQGTLSIAFMAGRTLALAIENPRQISAYEYPEEYGPRSPTFARGCLLPEQGILFISGTASIVGHQTLHAGDVIAQTRETLVNMQAVIDEANSRLNSTGFDSKNIFYRVYMRNSSIKSLIKKELQRALGSDIKAMFVRADICRHDLLLEIEATACLTSEITDQP